MSDNPNTLGQKNLAELLMQISNADPQRFFLMKNEILKIYDSLDNLGDKIMEIKDEIADIKANVDSALSPLEDQEAILSMLIEKIEPLKNQMWNLSLNGR